MRLSFARKALLAVFVLIVVGATAHGCGSGVPATAILTGTVVNAGGSPVAGAMVYLTGYTTTYSTDSSGNFQAALQDGQLTVTITARGYNTYIETFTVEEGTNTKQFQLETFTEGLTGTLRGTVQCSETGGMIPGAVVTITGTSLSATTDAQGSYRIENVPSGYQEIVVTKAGYDTYAADVWIYDNFTNVHVAVLEK